MDDTLRDTPEPPRAVDRRILALALPALGALVAEPLFVLVDSAVVGHLGTAELAGLTLASTLLVTAVGLFVFLAYATTAASARHIGAGDERGAAAAAVDGAWLAVALALLVTGACLPLAGWVFVLDGVLIGARDGRFLAAAGAVTLLAYLPPAAAVWLWAPDGAVGLA